VLKEHEKRRSTDERITGEFVFDFGSEYEVKEGECRSERKKV